MFDNKWLKGHSLPLWNFAVTDILWIFSSFLGNSLCISSVRFTTRGQKQKKNMAVMWMNLELIIGSES